jgi:Fur family transcriptional regulator, ferric uptake regulator
MQNIIQSLQSHGFRITPLRQELVSLFESGCNPLAYDDLLQLLKSRGFTPNKTTLYRELTFLCAQRITQEIDLGEGKKRYELANDHHHHLVCTACDAIEAVHLSTDIRFEEEKIKAEKGFVVTRHMLEFFGICGSCSKKGLFHAN